MTAGRLARLSVVLIALAFVGMACGEAELSKEEAEEELHKAQQEAQLAFARCVRDEGFDVRDPEPDQIGLGFINPPPEGVDPEELDEAAETCRRELADELEAAELSETGDPEMQDLVLAYARCMREAGIDMPDPDFSKPRSGPGVYFQRYADFGDPEFEAADGPCREKVFTPETGHSGGPESGPGGDETKPEQSGEPGERPCEPDPDSSEEEEAREQGIC